MASSQVELGIPTETIAIRDHRNLGIHSMHLLPQEVAKHPFSLLWGLQKY